MQPSVLICRENLMIVDQTYSILRDKCREFIDSLTVEDLRIGIWITAVRLSDGTTGTSATLPDVQEAVSGGTRDFGDLTPLHIRGRKVRELLESGKQTGIVRSAGMAVLSALSSRFFSSEHYNIVEDCDPVDFAVTGAGKYITLVGAFHSYIRKLSLTGSVLKVLELNEEAVPLEFRGCYVPASEYRKVISESDTLIISGQTLINSTISGLLDAARPSTRIIVSGLSGNIIPDILFSKGVNILGALRISDPELLFRLAAEGGTGYHLFQYCAKKICILNGEKQA